MKKQIEEKLIEFICANFIVEPDEFEWAESLVDQGIIDSFGLVEIADFLKKEFGVKTEQDEMIRDNFGSVYKMIDFIERKLS